MSRKERRLARMSHTRTILRRVCTACGLLALLAAPPAAAQSDPEPLPVVQPGGTLLFTSHDGLSSEVNPGIPESAQGTASVDTSTEMLQSTAFSGVPTRRAATRITERYAFKIDAGNGFDSLLLTQISGHLDMRGFMSVLGHGQAHAEAILRVRDTTESFFGPVIASYTIVRHEVDGKFDFAVGGSVGVQGGAPFIGGSAGAGLEYELSIDFALVRESQHFGFPVYLQRGRTYDIELVFESAAELGGLVGTAQARFYAPSGKSLSVENALDPENWIGAITTLVPYELPNLAVPNRKPLLGAGTYQFPSINLGILGVWGGGTMPVGMNFTMNPLNRTFGNTHAILDHIGAAHSIEDLVYNKLEYGTKLAGLDEVIPSPGVRLSRLRLSVEPDARELMTSIQASLAKRTKQALPRDLPMIPKDGLPMLAPGQTLSFAERDGAVAACNEDVLLPFMGLCNVDVGTERLQFIGTANRPFARASNRLVQWYDFDVHEGSNPGSALLTQVSGSLSMQGVLAVLGMGQTQVDITMAVRDITDAGDAPETAPIIMSHPVKSVDLASEIGISPGVSLGVQGGVPYAGAEFSVGLEFGHSFLRRNIRDTEDFTFVAMLQRGHRYRLELEIESMAKQGTAGLAISNFSPEPLADLLHPGAIMVELVERFGAVVPGLDIPRAPLTGAGTVRIPQIATFGPWTRNMPMNLDLAPLNRSFSSSTAFLEFAGLPTDFDALIADLIDKLPVEAPESEKVLDSPGVQVHNLTIMMQDDLVLLLKQAKSALDAGHFSMVRGDITGDGQVNAVDVQLVINAALGIDINP